MTRPTVLLAPGALYLFWTTGVYYVFELARDYDLVLLVNESYRGNEDFTRLIDKLANVRVYYVPDLRPVRRLHEFYATDVRRIVEEHRPRFILSNDICGMEMLYLFHYGRLQQAQGNPCTCLTIQASNIAIDFNKDQAENRKIHAGYYVRKYRMPPFLASWLVGGLTHTFRVLNTFVYPALYAGQSLRPWQTVAPVTWKRDSKGRFDCFLYYSDAEGAVLRRLYDKSCCFQKVQHPLRSHEAEARALLHANAEEQSIVILPSYVSVLLLRGDLGLSEPDAIEFLASRWVEIIRRLQLRFPSWPMRWKIHPQAFRDPHWLAVTERIRAAVPALEILDPAEKAEKLIFQSRVVVGDISTALVWAAWLSTKIVISFDVFGRNYRDLAERDNIWYVDDLDAFNRTSFDPGQAPGAVPSSGPRDVPTVRDYFAAVFSGAPVGPASGLPR